MTIRKIITQRFLSSLNKKITQKVSKAVKARIVYLNPNCCLLKLSPFKWNLFKKSRFKWNLNKISLNRGRVMKSRLQLSQLKRKDQFKILFSWNSLGRALLAKLIWLSKRILISFVCWNLSAKISWINWSEAVFWEKLRFNRFLSIPTSRRYMVSSMTSNTFTSFWSFFLREISKIVPTVNLYHRKRYPKLSLRFAGELVICTKIMFYIVTLSLKIFFLLMYNYSHLGSYQIRWFRLCGLFGCHQKLFCWLSLLSEPWAATESVLRWKSGYVGDRDSDLRASFQAMPFWDWYYWNDDRSAQIRKPFWFILSSSIFDFWRG